MIHKNLFLLFLLLAISQRSSSQNLNIDSTAKTVDLDEVIISVNKGSEVKRTVAQEVRVINIKEIKSLQAQTTADLLSNSGSVFVQKSQQGGGSPVIRGFEANRILLVIDGVRMNNLIYRGGHLQNIITLDNSILERVEVLYGPSSTMYGSDALGGVIHLYTKNPEFSNDLNKTILQVNAFSRYGSVNNEITGHADVNVGGKYLASLSSFTVSRFGNLESGKNKNPFYDSLFGKRPEYIDRINNTDSIVQNDDPFNQKFSGYSQYSFLQKLSYKKNENTLHQLNFQYSTSTNVPRYDKLTDSKDNVLQYSEWYYGPQKRLLAAYDLRIKNDSALFQNTHVGINYQYVQESRNTRKYKNDELSHRIEDVNVMGANVDFQRIARHHIIRVGVEAQYNLLKSTANEENILTGSISGLDTRYPDGTNNMTNLGAYWSHTLKINEKNILVDGIRLGYSSLYSTFVDKSFYDFPYSDVKQDNLIYSGNIGIIHNPNENIKYSLLLSSGFRVPNTDDLSKVFESAPGTVIVPNPDLKPEKTINAEFGFASLIHGKYYWENTIYYTRFIDAIITSPFNIDGIDSVIYNGTNSKVYANQNEGKAFLYGLSSSLKYHHTKHFTSSIAINYTYGQIITDSVNSPLDHIPPFILHFETLFTAEKYDIGLYINYNAWKRIQDYNLNGEDNEQYATPDGMPAWITLNLRGSYKLSNLLSLNAGIDNILDTQYRTFASGINAPGRNIFASIYFTFKK